MDCIRAVKTGVTPCMGVWIETAATTSHHNDSQVTPSMGVWIETTDPAVFSSVSAKSHPVWVCGLKRHLRLQ